MSLKMSTSKRNPNFSMNEIAVLVDNIEKHTHVLFSKQNNTVTNSKRNILWKCITERVNVIVGGFMRTPDEIRKKWSQLYSGVKTKSTHIA